ncbi:MAG: ABC transporter permease [Acidobacteriota bacterium]
MKPSREALATLYRQRGLLRDLIVRELTRRWAGSSLGIFWMVLHPLLIIGLFSLVFGQLMATRLGEGSTPFDYLVYLCAGLLPWFALQDAVQRSCGLFLENAGLVKKVAFPPVLLVGQLVGSALVTLTVSMALFVGVLTLSGRPPGAAVGLLVPAAILLIILVAGLVCSLSVLTVFFRDLEHLIPVATMLWFWLTPVVYDPGVLPAAVAPLLSLNPMVPILNLFRRALGAGPGVASQVQAAWPGLLVTLLSVLVGIVLFRGLVRDVPDGI